MLCHGNHLMFHERLQYFIILPHYPQLLKPLEIIHSNYKTIYVFSLNILNNASLSEADTVPVKLRVICAAGLGAKCACYCIQD